MSIYNLVEYDGMPGYNDWKTATCAGFDIMFNAGTIPMLPTSTVLPDVPTLCNSAVQNALFELK